MINLLNENTAARGERIDVHDSVAVLYYYVPANWYTMTQIPPVGEGDVSLLSAPSSGGEVLVLDGVVVGSEVEESPAAVQLPDPSS